MLDELFKAIRENSTPQTWSKGVEYARSKAVSVIRDLKDQIELRVKTDKAASVVVKLFPEDLDWQCSCSGDDDPCGHVIGAIIGIRQAQQEGKPLATNEEQSGVIIYEIKAKGELAFLERFLKHPDSKVEPLPMSLATLASGRVKGPAVSATSADLKIDLEVGGQAVTAPKNWQTIFACLREILPDNILFDGVAINFHSKEIGLKALVSDDGPGVRASITLEHEIQTLFKNNLAKTSEGLFPVKIPALTEAEAQLKKPGKFFGRQELGDLVSTILPTLSKKMPIDGLEKSTNLPRTDLEAYPYTQIVIHLNADKSLRPIFEIVYGVPPIAKIENGNLVLLSKSAPIRDFDAERKLKDEAARLNLESLGHASGDAAIKAITDLSKLGTPCFGEAIHYYQLHPQLESEHHFNEHDFSLDFVTSTNGIKKSASAMQVLQAWTANQSFVSLNEGGFAPIPKAWLNQHGSKIRDLLAARGDHATLPNAARPLLLELYEDLKEKAPESLETWVHSLTDNSWLDHGSPHRVKAELRPYQHIGSKWLEERIKVGVGALLADDMGLGKTIQTLNVIQGKTMVVAPTSVLFNWRDELAKFRPDLKVTLYHGGKRKVTPDIDVVLTSYGLLRLDFEILAQEHFELIIIDEAQYVKNPSSQAAKALRQFPSKTRIGLSGTPIENNLSDLWSLMEILNPGLLGSYKYFKERYSNPIQNGDSETTEALKMRVKPFILRRLKKDVLQDLPPRTEQITYVELSPEERSLYESVRALARKDVVAQLELSNSVISMLESLLRLRQAACHTALVPGSGMTKSSKLEAMVNLISELKNSVKTAEDRPRFLVFSQWTSLLDLCETAFSGHGISWTRLDGQTTNRQEKVDEFQDINGPDVILISLKAGGVGLNLTRADHVFILDPWWNPAGEEQASDRAHRIGQVRPVFIHRLVTLDTVEEGVMTLKTHKRALADSIVDGKGSDGVITRDDLLNLIG